MPQRRAERMLLGMTTQTLIRQRPGLITAGDILDNGASELRSEVLRSSETLLRTQVEAGPNANGGPLHVHPRQEERFIVQEGALRVRLGLRGSHLIGPGQEIAIPAGKPHTFRVEGSGARFIAEFRPPHEIGELFVDLFAIGGTPRASDIADLMERYPDDFFYAPLVPRGVQRLAARIMARRERRG
jgi:mannose-6-phosphate isomerase-like protein (cupin superfamily)